MHVQRLVLSHGGEVLHRQQVLGPVLKDGSVASIGDKLVRMLRHRRIQVVLDHQHDGRGLWRAGGVFANRPSVHRIGGAKAVHVNASVAAEFVSEFRCQNLVVAGIKIAERVAQGQLFFIRAQNVLAHRGVRNRGVNSRMGGELGRNSG